MITIELDYPELYDEFLSSLRRGSLSNPAKVACQHMTDQLSWLRQRNIKFSVDTFVQPRDRKFIVTLTFDNTSDATLFKIKWC